jgi:hypothetical protein
MPARILVLLLLAGCASAPSTDGWNHSTKDVTEWKFDMAECERFFGGSDPDRARCMASKGWRRKK